MSYKKFATRKFVKSHVPDKYSNVTSEKKILFQCEKLDPDPDIFRNSNTVQNATCCALRVILC